jgi:filamentous hemagglutinin
LEDSSFVATTVGCLTGGPAGCETGGFTGRNAVENNYLSNPADVRDPKIRQRILEAGQNCSGPSSCESMVAGMDAQIKLLSDDKIALMCGTDAQCVTDRKDERSLYVQVRNDAKQRLDNPGEVALSYLRDQKDAPYDKDKLSASVTRVQNGTADPNDPVDQSGYTG